MSELWRLSAVDAVEAVQRGDLEPVDLIDAAQDRSAAVDGQVNALPVPCWDRARAQAKRLCDPDADVEREATGFLHGLPVAVSDMSDVAGVPTTYGSKIYEFNSPSQSDAMAERLEDRGGLIVGKANVSEFVGTTVTDNGLFGPTRNPWNTSLTAGGASGGAAAAVASGQVWGATGTDLGGSLRVPAAYCGVVGMRPSLGRVPRGRRELPFDTLWIEGPIARNVADCALLLDALSGSHPLEPFAEPAPGTSFLARAKSAEAPGRVAYSHDLGILPVSEDVADVCESAALKFQDCGAAVEFEWPDFSGAKEVFQILRSANMAARLAPMLARYRDRLPDGVVAGIEAGLALSYDEYALAQRMRGQIYADMIEFFESFDVLCCPTVVTPAFPVDEPAVAEVDGMALESPVDWIGLTSVISLTGLPALTLPAGRLADGRPVGLQLVGGPHGEGALIGAAAALEATLDLDVGVPIDPMTL